MTDNQSSIDHDAHRFTTDQKTNDVEPSSLWFIEEIFRKFLIICLFDYDHDSNKNKQHLEKQKRRLNKFFCN